MERTLPAWFDDAKLGIFVHWTPASVPAFAPLTDDPFSLAEVHGWEHAMAHSPYVEWYQNSLSIEGSPVATTARFSKSCGSAKAAKAAASADRPATGRSSALRPPPRNSLLESFAAIREPCP